MMTDREIAAGVKCECADHHCPAHRPHANCNEQATDILYRVDMADEAGTAMCDACSDDAFASGLFTTHEDEDEEEN
jgi:hypothetical protein